MAIKLKSKNSIRKILALGKQEKPGESDIMTQEGTPGIEFITHIQKSARISGYA